MKKRILMGVLAIVMAAALIAGATMAWFTDSTEVPTAEFTAGTVIVNVDQEGPDINTIEGRSFENVNPGDCAKVIWTIVNDGTKSAEFRVKLSKEWEDELSADNVYYAPKPGSDWVMYEEDGDIYLYYLGGPVRGTYNYENPGTPLDPATVDLPIVVGFDGAATGNEYQGKKFTLNGIVEAIQSTNGAPAAEWGTAWTTVKGDGYSDAALKDYFINGPGKDMPCWTGSNYNLTTQVGWLDGGEFVEDSRLGTISLTPAGGSYPEGTIVIMLNTGETNDSYNFVKWMISHDGGNSFTDLADKEGNGPTYTLNYTMPGHDVVIRAIWDGGHDNGGEEEEEFDVDAAVNIEGAGNVSGTGSFDEGDQVTLTANANTGYTFTGWDYDSTLPDVQENGNVLTFTMPDHAVTVTANFEEIPVVTSIEISGPDSIEIPLYLNSPREKQYTAKVYDQNGNEMSNQTIVWSENKNHVEITQDGKLSVSWRADVGTVTITAKVGDVTGTKAVQLVDNSIFRGEE